MISPLASLLAQEEVQRPTAADVRARRTQVVEEVAIVTAGIFQGVGEDAKTDGGESAGRQIPLLVGRLGEGDDRGWMPSGVEGKGMEGVAEKVTHQVRLDALFAEKFRGLPPRACNFVRNLC